MALDPYLEDYFKYNKYFLTPVGGWPFPDDSKTEYFKISVGTIQHILTVIVFAVEFYELISNLDNIFITVEGVCVSVTAVSCFCKNYSFVSYRKYLREIFMHLNDLHVNIPFKERNDSIVKSNNNVALKAHFICKGLISLYMMPAFFYMFSPWWIKFKYNEFILPFPSKFPFDTNTWGNYMVGYSVEFVMTIGLILIFAAMETLFSSFILYLCSRIDILEYSMNMAVNEATADSKESYSQKFGRCIQYHHKILRGFGYVEEMYSFLLILQFTTSAIIICMLSFLSTQTSLDNDRILTFLAYFVCAIIQLFVYCFFGQKVEDKCNKLFENSFYIQWYEKPIYCQKDISFYLLFCRNEVKFIAYKLMPVNLETFFTIMKTTVSYYTMLVSFKNDDLAENI